MGWIFLVLICIVFTLLLKLVYCYDAVSKGVTLKEKLANIINLSRITALIFSLVFISGIAVYVIEIYVYHYSFFHSLNMSLLLMFVIPLVYRDIREQIIPNEFIVLGFAVRFITLVCEFFFVHNTQYNLVLSNLAGLLFGGGIFLLCSFLLKNSVGMGDVKLFAVLGFFVGFSGIFSVLFYTLLSSVIVGIVLMVQKKKNRKDFLPLAPFALIGVVLSIVLGI